MSEKSLLFVNASQVVTCAGPAAARRGRAMRDAEILAGAAVAVSDERIMAVGPQQDIEREFRDAQRVDCSGCILTPGLVDSHTHAVFGRPRHEEQELRAAGMSYMEIAERGGGIHASVRDFRARNEEELYTSARERVLHLASYGTTTVEIKSGYGLTLDDELKALRIIARLQADLQLRIVPTWLGAHEVPLEFGQQTNGRAAYIELLVRDVLPAVTADRLAVFADVFCEPGVFTPDEARAVLMAARAAGLGLKLHADEFEHSGGAELAVELGATSADHLGAVSNEGIAALGNADTVAVLLPGTLLFLGHSRQAPARALIDAGAAVALATDFNPGTSPTPNLPLILTLGVSQLRLSVAEAVIAVTVNAAAALGLAHETGQLAPGFSADIALFEADDVRELPYWYGDRRCRGSWVRGRACHPREAVATL